MAERANVRTCSGASFWAWGGRAQSAVREMNDSRYYQPLLLTSTIDDASATTPGYPPTRPASQPALSILSPPPSPPPPPPPLPDAASPTTQARERERVCAHVRATPDEITTPLTPRLAQLRLLSRALLPQRLALQQLKESSAIGRAAALEPRRSTYSLLRFSLPTSQLTASDLRVGPLPPTRNRTQQRAASEQATCCHHTTRRLSQASRLVTPTTRSTFPVYSDLLDCVSCPSTLCIVCCSAYRPCIILSSAYC